MSLDEAGRQLEAAIHDARVAFDCIELDDLERAHTNAITARAAVDAAEYAIRVEAERREGEGEKESSGGGSAEPGAAGSADTSEGLPG
ncbi:hypothetical protein [Streptomonospora wellingtoniae]|uniref:Uncharacterized protein n=1 Tax=Streptomonospora wellingtoniae TaxID=3075544 RepID=A0ABU2KMT9_9ACTN|nr:hypothetical protein [Streptomonospora sp. DSM 45055]MDT0300587.1 hypothetical protein [Streptomonospora sp. DSM 45055]